LFLSLGIRSPEDTGARIAPAHGRRVRSEPEKTALCLKMLTHLKSALQLAG
jgi:hypothetical protein